MRRILTLAVLSAGVAVAASAQPDAVFHCYGFETQIGVAARREFHDDRGLVVKEILYRSTERTARRTCPEDALRVYIVRTIARDALGRSVRETETNGAGEVERILRHEYAGDSARPARDVWSGPGGDRRYEIRRADDRRESHLYYNEYYNEDGLVVGVASPLPTSDVEYALRWGTEVDGWSCGIAFSRGSLYVHLKNGTRKETPAGFVDWFETDLRTAKGSKVPPLPSYVQERAATPKRPGSSRLIAPGDAAFAAYPLESRYGALAPGRYSLAVWHPHPTTGIMVLSNTFEFDIKPPR